MAEHGFLTEAKKRANDLRANDREEGLCRIAIAIAMSGDMDAARAAAETIGKRWHRDTVYYEIVPMQIRAGDLAGAADSIAKMENQVRRQLLELQLGPALAKAGDLRGARAAFDRVREYARKSDKSSNYLLICDVGANMLKLGLEQEAKQDFAQAAVYAGTLDLYAVAEAQFRAGDIQGARQNYERVWTELATCVAPGPRIDTPTDAYQTGWCCTRLSHSQARVGDRENAIKHVRGLKDRCYLACGLLGLARGMDPNWVEPCVP
jgi:hypothetical protein